MGDNAEASLSRISGNDPKETQMEVDPPELAVASTMKKIPEPPRPRHWQLDRKLDVEDDNNESEKEGLPAGIAAARVERDSLEVMMNHVIYAVVQLDL